MYIVFYQSATGTSRHSAWKTIEGAKEQVRVLREKGWHWVSYDYYNDYNYEDGHYFI